MRFNLSEPGSNPSIKDLKCANKAKLLVLPGLKCYSSAWQKTLPALSPCNAGSVNIISLDVEEMICR